MNKCPKCHHIIPINKKHQCAKPEYQSQAVIVDDEEPSVLIDLTSAALDAIGSTCDTSCDSFSGGGGSFDGGGSSGDF